MNTGNLLNNKTYFSETGASQLDPCVCTIKSPGGTVLAEFQFQHGPLGGERDTNGVVIEDLISVVIDRLTALNQPPYNCRENSIALTKLEEALLWLGKRTADRRARGVEGTETP